MRPVTIHVGLPKTGSTALQQNLFVRHPDLAFIGRPLTRFSVRQAQVFGTILERPADAWTAGLDRFRDELHGLIASRPGEAIVLSHEELAAPAFGNRVGRLEVARRLGAVLPEARILLVVRNQLAALASVHHQLTTVGSVDEPLEGWARRTLADPTLSGLYDVRAARDDFALVFGDRVHLMLQEELRDDPHRFVAELCALVGVDPARAPSVTALRNARPTEGHALTPELQTLVHARFAPGNRALAPRLPLSRHGYPL